MGLVLSFRPSEDFYVDDQRFIVSEITGPGTFIIRRVGDGAEFRLVDDGHGHEIAPRVIARVALRGQGNLARIDLTAPPSVKLVTGENYRAARQQRA